MKKTIWKYFADSLLIIFSVLFALLINSTYENLSLKKKKSTAIKGITDELIRNKAIVSEWLAEHTEIRNDIAKAAFNEKDSLYQSLLKFDFFNFGLINNNQAIVSAFLTNTAWETTKESGVLSEFDFETAQVITHAYDMQTLLGEQTLTDFVNYYYDSEVHEIDNLQKTLKLFMLRFYDLTTKEETLLKLYERALIHLGENL